MSTFAVHPAWVQRAGIYEVTQRLHDKGLCVTAPPGRKYFAASPIAPKPKTLLQEILAELRRG
jgi:hypothetical protein